MSAASEMAYVANELSQVLPRDHANIWLFTPRRALNHEKPATLINEGRHKEVLDLIEAIADGVFA